jgi:hypothetical protein
MAFPGLATDGADDARRWRRRQLQAGAAADAPCGHGGCGTEAADEHTGAGARDIPVSAARPADRPAVAADAMDCGATLARHYAAEALRLCQSSAADPDLQLAKQTLAWLWSRGESMFCAVDMHRLDRAAIREKATATKIVGVLVDHGYLEQVPRGAEINGSSQALRLQARGEKIDEQAYLGVEQVRCRPYRLKRCGWGLEAGQKKLKLALVDQFLDMPQRRVRDSESVHGRLIRRQHPVGAQAPSHLNALDGVVEPECPAVASTRMDDALMAHEIVRLIWPAVTGQIGRRGKDDISEVDQPSRLQ